MGHPLEIEPGKRLALATSFLKVQSARVLDDLTEMFIKRLFVFIRRARMRWLTTMSAISGTPMSYYKRSAIWPLLTARKEPPRISTFAKPI